MHQETRDNLYNLILPKRAHTQNVTNKSGEILGELKNNVNWAGLTLLMMI